MMMIFIEKVVIDDVYLDKLQQKGYKLPSDHPYRQKYNDINNKKL
jgi:hypothetical protein